MDSPSIWHAFGRQLRNPTGVAGRVTGVLMRLANAEPNRLAITALRIDPCDTVLELGFGPGQAIQLMVREAVAGRVYGIDHSPVMMEQAAKRNRPAIRDGRVILYRTQFDRLPFRNATIDKILAVNVIYFWSDPTAVLREIRRVLRPGGRLSIYATDKTTMHRWQFAGAETHRLYDAMDVSSALQQAGFNIRRIHTRKVRLIGCIQGLLTTTTSPLMPSQGHLNRSPAPTAHGVQPQA